MTIDNLFHILGVCVVASPSLLLLVFALASLLGVIPDCIATLPGDCSHEWLRLP